MSIGIWQVVLILAIVLILFGAGKLPKVMGDVAKGIKNFKSGMKDEDDASATGQIAQQAQAPAAGSPAQPAAAAQPQPAAAGVYATPAQQAPAAASPAQPQDAVRPAETARS